MNLSALIFMLVIWGVVIGLTAYCFYKMLTVPADRAEEEKVPPTL